MTDVAPRPVIFDLDGTLLDSAPDIAAALNAVMVEEGHAVFSLSEVISFVGLGLAHLVGLACEARGIDRVDVPALSARVLQAYTAQNGAHARLYPNVAASLEALKKRGHALGVCTNKPLEAAKLNLAHFGLDGLFDVVIGGDSFAERKPDPRPLLAAAEALGARAIFVGDSEIDEETARRAGLDFLFFTQGYCKAPIESLAYAAKFDDFAELEAIIAAAP